MALFRQKSLERLNDPERLDQLFRIVSPLNWLVLAVLLSLLLVALGWGFFGTIATRIHGNGILVSRGQQIYDAVAEAEGRISQIYAQIGDHVKQGQVVAQLDMPILRLEVSNKRQQMLAIKKQYEELKAFLARDLLLESKHNLELQENWKKDLKNANLHIKFLKDAIEAREKLVGGGAISKQELADLKSRYYKELQERDAIASKMAENKIEAERRLEQNQARLRELHHKLLQATQDYTAAKRQFEETSTVDSPVDGRVIEVIGKPGAIVKHGETVLDIEGHAEVVDAAVYVPAAEGKNIKPGMQAHIVPSTVKKQEFGSIIGEVTQVARFPSSVEGMMGVLENQKLVEDFTKSGPQLFVRVDLHEAPTVSGYKWTSSQGPELEISNGTLCTVEITVKTQAPITLIIPALKKLIGYE
ncbi:NHLP bacteriocin system secretion protein [Legionella londiniensis]|uniref:Hemolysin D n=1 Tax=Legionella londiniensis TaxID=45068 RepID=A0A0W0VJ45_9GAMM|nr:NHLP bacteriocin system secretion protein [Legionella londiniensis]KTD19785.1 hemolysin D [Legionella londiniensis]STX92304.1 HlyD family secretion protein [Legionella londiniensis]